MSVYGSLLIVNNTANYSGGGAFFHLADMLCYGHCNFSNNKANIKGGGIHAISAVITLKHGNKWKVSQNTRILLTVNDNEAGSGGGAYFEVESKVYGIEDSDYQYSIEFSRNSATYGGAMFVQDRTYSGVCDSTSRLYQAQTGCFLQMVYSSEDTIDAEDERTHDHHLIFTNNTAVEGSVLYGGLLDRCTVSLSDDLYVNGAQNIAGRKHNNAFIHFQSEGGVNATNEIASDAVRVCFCDGMTPNCSLMYEPPPIQVKKGELFNVTVVAVDQVNHPVSATIRGSLPIGNILGEGKQLQNTTKVCTNLIYNISSPHDSVDLGLYARKDPCKDLGLSKTIVKIYFKNCTCPIGFQPSDKEIMKCHCECHEKLKPYITVCEYLTNSFVRKSNSWIGFINNSGYIIHPYCPYDFCFSPANAVIKLSEPNVADTQCDYNRSGLLCGQCKHGLSLSIGTPRCVRCPKHWPMLLVVSILAGILGGLVVVIIFLLLNMTVALGTLNGLIFYANVVVVNRSSFLPFSRPNLITVFINMLNTQLGLEYCFYKGMDEYGKTWLSIGFPLYLLSLVLIVILVSKCSSRCARLLGRSNPVATLASLILLTYEGLLRTIIDIFSFADLKYPDGTHHRVWLPDANLKYLQGKHIPLFLTGIIIVVVGLAYTVLLFSWQWLLQSPNERIFSWIRNTKLNSFMDAYHAPYQPKYRYWTGLLLFIRALLSITIAANVSGNLRNNILTVGILIAFLILLKSYLGEKIYRKKVLDYLEVACYFNLLLFTLASLYSLGDQQSQKNSAYISVTAALLMFLAVVAYHIHCTLSKVKCYKRLSDSIYYRIKGKEANASHEHNYEMTAKVSSIPSFSEVSMISSLQCPVRDLKKEEQKHTLSSSKEKVYESKLYDEHSASGTYLYESNHLRQSLLLEL